ncbi:MAG: hypothetical protein J07HQW2_00753 [Haloquadratum walsbyi J07HQW2]|uniref:Uncharacterized protein n=1 Tax=Haloquadratum walsbyi J07HQW2 TaxID=1238425 RepID=U1MV79_9EURY|nr:MAG: hypothetical protein J07HQW2_00753 [Haloquadratum walsbyi J07HQW2]
MEVIAAIVGFELRGEFSVTGNLNLVDCRPDTVTDPSHRPTFQSLRQQARGRQDHLVAVSGSGSGWTQCRYTGDGLLDHT